jgi:hypothetical protein
MRVLMTGATGFLGKRIGARLAKAGHELVVLSRDPGRARAALPFVLAGTHGWDAARELPPPAAFEGVQGVVHLAGEPIADGRWTEARKAQIRDSRVVGTRNLLEGIRALERRPSVVVGASAIGFYGDRGDEPLTEESAAGADFLAQVTRDWESELFRSFEGAPRRVALRLGFVLGPEGGALKRLLPVFKAGLGSRLGSGRQWVSWVHADDVAGICELALVEPRASGPLNVVAPNPVRQRELARELAAALRRPMLLAAPAFALRIALGGEMAGALLGGQRLNADRAIALGYRFAYPRLDAALRSMT